MSAEPSHLVLGATGFLGSHIARALADEGRPVRILRRTTSSLAALEGVDYEDVLGDLDDSNSLRQAFAGCRVAFHAAGYYPLYALDSHRQKDKALSQIRNVLDAASATPSLERLVYTSSLSTIGRPKTGLADESLPFDPATTPGLYYEIKFLMEEEVRRAAQGGLPAVILNPTAVFGDYDVKPTSGTLIVRIAQGKMPWSFEAKMNAVDVRDVARGHLAAWRRGRIGQRYILGGHNTTMAEFGRRVAERAGVKPPRRRIPLGLVRTLAGFSEWISYYLLRQKKPPLPRIGIDFLEYGAHYDDSLARRELELPRTPLLETIDRSLAWFRTHGYIGPTRQR